MIIDIALVVIAWSLISINGTLLEIKEKTGKHEVQLLLTEALKKQHSESEDKDV